MLDFWENNDYIKDITKRYNLSLKPQPKSKERKMTTETQNTQPPARLTEWVELHKMTNEKGEIAFKDFEIDITALLPRALDRETQYGLTVQLEGESSAGNKFHKKAYVWIKKSKISAENKVSFYDFYYGLANAQKYLASQMSYLRFREPLYDKIIGIDEVLSQTPTPVEVTETEATTEVDDADDGLPPYNPDDPIEILVETKKGVKIAQSGRAAWIMKKWLRENNTLTPKGEATLRQSKEKVECAKQSAVRYQAAIDKWQKLDESPDFEAVVYCDFASASNKRRTGRWAVTNDHGELVATARYNPDHNTSGELQAALMAVRAVAASLDDNQKEATRVKIMTDAQWLTTAKIGKKDKPKQADQLRQYARKHGLGLSIEWIASENNYADKYSRTEYTPTANVNVRELAIA